MQLVLGNLKKHIINIHINRQQQVKRLTNYLNNHSLIYKSPN